MGYKYWNFIIKYQVDRKTKAIKRLFDYQDSRLWSVYSYKNKQYTVKDIVKDILKLAPFSDVRHRRLVGFVEKQMNVVLWDRDHSRWTKSHRGNIHNTLKKEFAQQRIRRVSSKHQIIDDIQIKIVAIEFDRELTNVIYENDTPKTNTPYQHDMSTYSRKVLYHEYKGDYKLIEGKPKQVKTFKEIAYPMMEKYLDKHTDLPKLKLQKALRIKIKEVSKWIYPTRKDTHPNHDLE